MSEPILIARGEADVVLYPRMANRHGLIAGATGTGKTVSLQAIAHHLSARGVPVFMADIKGDLSGMSQAGSAANTRVAARVEQLKLADEGFGYAACPVVFWDIYGRQGHPIRATVSDMGPLLFARLLNLNDTQSGVLTLVFKIADDNGMLLLDLKDLRAMVQFVGENATQYTTEYGNISAASIGAIQRGLLALESEGGDTLFGEPALSLDDLIQTDAQGRGVVNILAADQLMQSPKLYSTFLLWLLSELFETLPEVGDVDKPKLVFFFDEAHLLFNDAPKALTDKIEQVVRLIRSKGVGVYFITQSPLDIPESVLGQLGNRVQHALRAFTPKDQKAVRSAAETFRANPKLDTAAAILELGVGEALVSTLDEKGTPGIVERAFMCPPGSQIGAITAEQRQQMITSSLIYGHYEKLLDRESAYEMLKGRAVVAAEQAEAAKQAEADAKQAALDAKAREKAEALAAKEREKAAALAVKERERIEKQEAKEREQAARLAAKEAERQAREDAKPSAFQEFASGMLGNAGRQLGRELTRGLLGSLLGGGTRRRR